MHKHDAFEVGRQVDVTGKVAFHVAISRMMSMLRQWVIARSV